MFRVGDLFFGFRVYGQGSGVEDGGSIVKVLNLRV